MTNDVKAAATESETGSNAAKRVWRMWVQLSAEGRRLHRSWYRWRRPEKRSAQAPAEITRTEIRDTTLGF
ncbi:hypothetical protein BN2475_170029 [Paraburkholderia ribeironis]|uniref:Uncharacterized protein n=1 Tax=Paraburkholderia ribeironis TaxID=1247936 RepID=A0A1N7RUC4_9BURK|nr:hypothetical protein BN2475_170029 [Paraburkholderia ribeironis]